jgi:hypothetical protein
MMDINFLHVLIFSKLRERIPLEKINYIFAAIYAASVQQCQILPKRRSKRQQE